MPLVARQNGLVDGSHSPPRLRGGECAACGRRFFPFQTYGCERCGAHGDHLRPTLLPPRGTVLAATTLRHGGGRPLEPPVVVARVRLEPDLEVRGRVDAEAAPAPGTEVVATLVSPGGEGEPHELRFVPVRA